MSVRKRTWTTRKGEKKEAWIVAYADQDGERHIQTFSRKKEADAYHDTVRGDVREGIHTPVNKSIKVAEAAKDWLAFVKLEGVERSTLDQYSQHVTLHIVPRIGGKKLAELTQPRIENFRDDLLANMSSGLAKKVLTSLKSLLKDAKRRGNVAQNVAQDVKIKKNNRDKTKLKVGVDIPTPGEIKRFINAASENRRRPLLLTAIFTGLRASELRGLRWDPDVDLKKGELHVRQRADRYNEIGNPKSEAGERTIPLGPLVLNTLREWKLVCPRGNLGLVFSTRTGRIEYHKNILRNLGPLWVKAGVTKPVKDADGKPVRDADGKPVVEAKYSGLHVFRHFYASWCLNRRADGGLELPLKLVQERLGHSSIVMTANTYGHLFPRTDDGSELAAAEHALLA
jgi:integrase